MVSLAGSVEAFHIGTVDNPTIDGQPFSKATQEEGLINESSIKSKLLPISFSSNMHPISSNDWTPSHIERVLEKAAEGGKLSYVLSAAKRYGLPASVALIPVVESRYQSDAVSNKGAVGLWQLSRAVASDFDFPADARMDWRASTEVALQHISRLQNHYGRWDLTWAAYNAGQGRIDSALKKNPHANSALELNLPEETTNYVQSLLSLQSELAQVDVKNA
jgi:membrane-bound lytic murein transglycosylase D